MNAWPARSSRRSSPCSPRRRLRRRRRRSLGAGVPAGAERCRHDATASHARLVESLRAYSFDLEEIQAALEEGDQAAITESLSGLESLDSVRELRAAGDALQELGYTFEAS
ncbi:MAG TPA: hypothetical protein VHK22_05065 [Gaiellaceae bacterium]|nr:hypothetical protein [Gaiellaceae bacterium]